MRVSIKLACSTLVLSASIPLVLAQDLAPRAYLITPIHSNAVTLTESFYTGNLPLDAALPITGATATVNIPRLHLQLFDELL
jgi:hypothetical protein